MLMNPLFIQSVSHPFFIYLSIHCMNLPRAGTGPGTGDIYTLVLVIGE